MQFKDRLNKICEDLPEGYQIIIECENGYGGVKLLIPGSDAEIEDIDTELSVEGSIMWLVDVANSGVYDKANEHN